MSDAAGPAGRERILLAVDHPTNRRLLAEHLSVRWDVVAATAAGQIDQPFDQSFDLALVDRRALERLADPLARLRERRFPRFVPVLLLLSPGEAEPGRPALSELVDEALWGPIDRVVLDRRVATLLRVRRLSSELDRRNRQLEAISNEKDELLGIAAHDLRSPLTSLWMGARLLQEARLDHAERQRVVGAIRARSESMLELLGEILDVERIEQGFVALDQQEQRVGPIVARAVDGLMLLSRDKEIALVVDDRAPDVVARVDARRLGQVLTNLLSNAIKYSHRGTTVTVTLTAPEGKGLELAVSDHGVGIDDVDRDKVFRKFSRFNQPTAGEPTAGLGLAIVKKLVELHGGTVDFTSVPGEGTTFTVKLSR